MRYGIFFNPNAGDGNAETIAKKMREKLEQVGHSAEFLTAPDPEKAVNIIKESLDKLDSLIAIGGDGSLNIVGTAFGQAGKTLPLGIIPGGTINNFAKRWHLPLDPDAAMEVILAGHQRKVGIAACQDRQKAVISSFTFGSFADISNEVRQSEKRKFGLIVYPLKALKQLGKNRSYPVEITAADYHEKLKVWFSLVTTTHSIGGREYIASDSDELHVSILHNMRFSKLLQLLRFIFTGRLKDSEALTYLETNTLEMKPLTDQPIYSRIDGDKGPALPLTVEFLADFVSLYVPKNT
ncbi:diacylglycerol kinase family lipid kinase [Enterococcus pseudoavium]|uniref:Diacylglycerol kinase family lipid kinase n=1 Tax=Enterococcus pseudoavium TaxID=44007 RepID=A0AAE4L1L8_9ENTE|nr:diacylglycerol kinase family lipid kinase [Enterococcus pseudoavium]MDT2735798.1 diacylglycerol kinase family lipid kinase [Enterococcus pseudoavium]